MKSTASRFAIIAIALAGATLAQADAWVYTGGTLSVSWFDAGPDLVVNQANYFYNDYTFDYAGIASYGLYSNSVYNSFNGTLGIDNVLETADGNAYTSFLGEEEQIDEVFNYSTTTSESITFAATAYAFGDDGISGPEDSANYNTSSYLVEDFGDGTYVASAGVLNNQNGYSYAGQTDSGQVTVTVAPDTYADFVGRIVEESIASSKDTNAAPSPAAIVPFSAGLLTVLRRRRAR